MAVSADDAALNQGHGDDTVGQQHFYLQANFWLVIQNLEYLFFSMFTLNKI